tara:strand:- start:276 stop:1367 length:1092 start_codon:yes stop_codon:yes gene_type:complete
MMAAVVGMAALQLRGGSDRVRADFRQGWLRVQPMTVTIGHHTVRAPVLLAPMSGVTDLPFRRQAWRFGAGLVFSEMVASETLAQGRKDVVRRMARDDTGGGPHIVQLAGREAKWMSVGAELAAEAGADIIDINMGCPARQVTKGLSGSALMRDLDHAMTLVEATVGAVDIPVTLKMRLGWDHDSLNAPELAQRAEAAGVRMVTVHGRTRQQFYKDQADWAAVHAVRQAVSIPLVVNGDIGTTRQAREALGQSGADMVMVGRAAQGLPWLPGQIAAELRGDKLVIALADKIDALHDQTDESLTLYGTRIGIRMMRKHYASFVDAEMPEAEQVELRSDLCRADTPEAAHAALDRCADHTCAEWAA